MKQMFLTIGVSMFMFAMGCQHQTTTSDDSQSNSEVTTSAQSHAADQTPVQAELAIGDPAPAWASLQGTDDQEHSLTDLADARAVIVVFTCNQCPVAVAYEDRLIELAKDYADRNVKLVAINVNNGEKELLPAMKARADEKDFNFPYVHDPSQQIARDYGATVTPHAFVLDEDRTVVYRGAIDDSMKADSVTQQYVRDAVDAVLADETVAVTESKAMGCGIKYE